MYSCGLNFHLPWSWTKLNIFQRSLSVLMPGIQYSKYYIYSCVWISGPALTLNLICIGGLKLKAQNCYNLPAKMPTKDLQWAYNIGNVGFIKDVLIKLFWKNIFLRTIFFWKKANFFIFTQIIYVVGISRIQTGPIRMITINNHRFGFISDISLEHKISLAGFLLYYSDL